jgi:hypothetical protein
MAAAATASATPGRAADRMQQSTVGWEVQNPISPTDLQSLVADGTKRITDVHVESVGPLMLSAILIHNGGAYGISDEHLFTGLAVDTAISDMENDGRRPIVMEPYVNSNGAVVVAGLSVPNTDADKRGWAVIRGGYSYVTSNMPSGYRPITIRTYVDPSSGNREYLVTAVKNTEGYGWYWFFNVHANDISSGSLVPGDASLIDASADNNDSMELNVVYYTGLPTPHGYYEGWPYFDVSLSDMVQTAKELGYRLLCYTEYTLHGTGTSDGDTEYFGIEGDNE